MHPSVRVHESLRKAGIEPGRASRVRTVDGRVELDMPGSSVTVDIGTLEVKHGGPGIHSGTGTPQAVHSGGGLPDPLGLGHHVMSRIPYDMLVRHAGLITPEDRPDLADADNWDLSEELSDVAATKLYREARLSNSDWIEMAAPMFDEAEAGFHGEFATQGGQVLERDNPRHAVRAIIEAWKNSAFTHENPVQMSAKARVSSAVRRAAELEMTGRSSEGEQIEAFEDHEGMQRWIEVARATYDLTQHQLRAAGVEEVTLFRGHGRDDDDRRLTSWTVDADVADMFGAQGPRVNHGEEPEGDPERWVTGRTFKREDIFAWPVSGFSQFTEGEMIALPGEDRRRRPAVIHDLDEFSRRHFDTDQWAGLRPRKEIHHRSGFEVEAGLARRLKNPDGDRNPDGSLVRGEPVFEVIDHGDPTVPGRRPGMFGPEVRGTEPVKYVYRGMSTEEYAQSKRRGYLQSDMRGVISEEEGTNAGLDPRTAMSYLPGDGSDAVIVKMRVEDEDDWFTIHNDSYLRTTERVPMDRIESVSPTMRKVGGTFYEVPGAERSEMRVSEADGIESVRVPDGLPGEEHVHFDAYSKWRLHPDADPDGPPVIVTTGTTAIVMSGSDAIVGDHDGGSPGTRASVVSALDIGIGSGAYTAEDLLRNDGNPSRAMEAAQSRAASARENEALQNLDEAIPADRVARFINDFNHEETGLSLRMTRAFRPHPNNPESVSVKWDIVDSEGEFVGGTSRKIKKDGTVDHVSFRLEPEYRGQGFGTAFIDHSMTAYQREGFTRADVSAVSDGSYAWAALGARLDNDKTPVSSVRSLIQRLESYRHREGVSPDTSLKAQALANALKDGHDIDMREIASLGVDDPHVFEYGPHKTPAHLGKGILSGQGWIGYFEVPRPMVSDPDPAVMSDDAVRATREALVGFDWSNARETELISSGLASSRRLPPYEGEQTAITFDQDEEFWPRLVHHGGFYYAVDDDSAEALWHADQNVEGTMTRVPVRIVNSSQLTVPTQQRGGRERPAKSLNRVLDVNADWDTLDIPEDLLDKIQEDPDRLGEFSHAPRHVVMALLPIDDFEFTTRDGRTYEASIRKVKDRGGRWQAHYQILDEYGLVAGEAFRTVRETEDGQVYHDSFGMEEPHQGQGVGKAFYDHSFEAYRSAGIRSVVLAANADVGGYAWASMGATLESDTGSIRRVLFDRLEREIEDYDSDLFRVAEIEIGDLHQGSSMMNVAALGLNEDHVFGIDGNWHLGKALLVGTDWPAHFDLDELETAKEM